MGFDDGRAMVNMLRPLLKRPAFTAVAVITLAVGIGANTAIFSVINGVLLRPLPYPDSPRIARLWEATARSPRVNVSLPNLRDWRDRLTSFDSLAGYAGATTTVAGGTEPALTDVYAVTREFFDVFQVRPARGRLFDARETVADGPPAAIVSDRFWRRQLGEASDLSALHIQVNGVSASVVGVMPAGFEFPADTDVWLPLEHWPDDSGRTAHNYRVVGRLKVPVEQARAESRVVGAQLQREHPGDQDAVSITIVPLHEALTGTSRTALLMLLAAVGVVLLIACANVASAILARDEERRTELAIRTALGASRGRLMWQLLAESLLLGLFGAVGGLVLGAWLLRAFLELNTLSLAGQRVELDASVLAFTVALGILSPALFGIVPALVMSRLDVRHVLVEGGRGMVGQGRRHVRNVLIAAETSVALVLLVACALLIHSFWNLTSIDPGFEPRGVAAMTVAASSTNDPAQERSARFYERLLSALAAVPEIESVGVTTVPPMSGGGPSGVFVFEGEAAPRTPLIANYLVVSPGYFPALRIPIVQGRSLDDTDRPGRPVSVVVNQEFVRRYIGNGGAIGRRFRYLGMDSKDEPMMTIVGVSRDARSDSLATPPEPEAYVTYLQRPRRTSAPMLVVARARTEGAVAALPAVLKRTVASIDEGAPVRIGTLTDRMAESVADRRFTASLLSAFALVAVLLAALGIYGVLARFVAQRMGEIGVRMALGADATSVLRLVVNTAMRPVGVGLVGGVVAAAFAVRLLRSLLFEVTPLDPAAFAGAVVLFVAVALLATLFPAWRATRIDPLLALRS